MKLLNCIICNDILAIKREPRQCECGKSVAVYVPGGKQHCESQLVKVLFMGTARILGIGNPEYMTMITDTTAQPIIYVEAWDDPAEDFEWMGALMDERHFYERWQLRLKQEEKAEEPEENEEEPQEKPKDEPSWYKAKGA